MIFTYQKVNFKIVFVLTIVLFTLIALTGCNNSTEIKEVKVYEMIDFDQEKENSLKTFNKSTEIKAFEEAFKKMKKQEGIVDIIEPEYKVEIGNNTYFMWLSEEVGMVMDNADTNTVYTLPKKTADSLKKMLK